MSELDSEDSAIDRVLGGLREAQAHAGLGQRVKLALERRNFEAAAETGSRLRFWQVPAVTMIGVAAVMLLIAGWTIHVRKHIEVVARETSAFEGQSEAEVMRPPTALEGGLRLKAAYSGAHGHRARLVAANQITAIKDVGAAALPSFPAPEAPLTEQEKLLATVALHAEPAQVAALNPEQREELAAVDALQLKRFFQPSELEEKIDALQAAQLPSQN